MSEKRYFRAAQSLSKHSPSIVFMSVPILLVVWLASVCAAQVQTQTSPVTVLYNFPISSVQPMSLIKARDGRFYGTCLSDGDLNLGTVFRLHNDGSWPVLYEFPKYPAPNEGDGPQGALVEGSDGNFYGTTIAGGSNLMGTIYRITPDGVFTSLYSFGSVAFDGAYPWAGLIQGPDGNFYGTTKGGGRNNVGTVFRMTPEGTVTILHHFALNQVPTGGARPQTNFIQGRDGLFYSVTGYNQDSNGDYGTVFRISKKGHFEVVYRFGPSPGGYGPVAPLVQASDGNFYGTTYFGGRGTNAAGTVFRMTPSRKVAFLHTFHSTTKGGPPVWGNFPFNGLLEGKDGFFYSTIMGCGRDQLDCAYRISQSGKFLVLHIFSDQEGMGTNGFVQGEDGLLYGDAQGGGILNGGIRAYGTAFSFKLQDGSNR